MKQQEIIMQIISQLIMGKACMVIQFRGGYGCRYGIHYISGAHFFDLGKREQLVQRYAFYAYRHSNRV